MHFQDYDDFLLVVCIYREGDSGIRASEAGDRDPSVRVRAVQAESQAFGESTKLKRLLQHKEVCRREWVRFASCCSVFQCTERDCLQKKMKLVNKSIFQQTKKKKKTNKLINIISLCSASISFSFSSSSSFFLK